MSRNNGRLGAILLVVVLSFFAFFRMALADEDTGVPDDSEVEVEAVEEETEELDCSAPPDDWTTYTVQPGDTLSAITVAADGDLNEVVEYNCIDNPGVIRTGTILFVPNPIEAEDVDEIPTALDEAEDEAGDEDEDEVEDPDDEHEDDEDAAADEADRLADEEERLRDEAERLAEEAEHQQEQEEEAREDAEEHEEEEHEEDSD